MSAEPLAPASEEARSLEAQNEELRDRLEELQYRLEDAEQALDAIRTGKVDSLVIEGPEGPRVFSLEGATHSYRVLVEAMNEGAATLSEEGVILYCNACFARLLGIPLERAIGSTLVERIADRHRKAFQALLGRSRETDNRQELTLLSGEALEEIPVYLSASWMVDDGRGTFCLVATDLRQQKRSEALVAAEKAARQSEARYMAELERAELMQEQLREGDRRKDQFLAILSHELRNPLAPIRNGLFILDRAAPGGEQARRAQAVIGRQVNQLARLVDDLLDMTRVTQNKIRLQRAPVELNELLRRTVEDYRSLFDSSGVEFELSLAPSPLCVYGDSNRLAQVMGNLLQNAAKFTGQGGRVRVALELDNATGRARLSVADTGVGMQPEMLAHLFEPFMQASQALDRSAGGLGLGLALVKALVELHGGTVSARSDGIGKGAEFVIELPLDATPLPHVGHEHASAPQTTRRVLIIEDNTDSADSLRDVLEYDKHTVEVAHSGQEGIAKARAFKPDLVLCDIGLPGMDGYEVARALRQDPELKAVCLVALSGYALPEDIVRATESGFDHHLAKPPRLDRLQELIDRL